MYYTDRWGYSWFLTPTSYATRTVRARSGLAGRMEFLLAAAALGHGPPWGPRRSRAQDSTTRPVLPTQGCWPITGTQLSRCPSFSAFVSVLSFSKAVLTPYCMLGLKPGSQAEQNLRAPPPTPCSGAHRLVGEREHGRQRGCTVMPWVWGSSSCSTSVYRPQSSLSADLAWPSSTLLFLHRQL